MYSYFLFLVWEWWVCLWGNPWAGEGGHAPVLDVPGYAEYRQQEDRCREVSSPMPAAGKSGSWVQVFIYFDGKSHFCCHGLSPDWVCFVLPSSCEAALAHMYSTFFPLYFGCTMRHGWSYFPNQWLNPCSLQCKCSVLINGPPGTPPPPVILFCDLASNCIYN